MQAGQDKSILANHLTLGVCYYPEHWDQSLWADDLARMIDHGIEVVRVFEFAWSVVEPHENVYDFTLFDTFLSLAQEKGMQVIMCTPTATPPAWLTHAHPQVLGENMQGQRLAHGHRRHYNYNSPVYLDYTKKIVTALAQRYGHHPAIIGWQLDNEFNCETDTSYSDSDRAAFRQYLKDHFKTLDALNDAIGARFWNQTYSDWGQVSMERHTIHDHANPHLALLEKRFISRSTIAYAKVQSDILRQYIGSRFITTNGVFGHLDNIEFTNTALDFMCYDSYPNFGYGRDDFKSDNKDGATDRMSSQRLSYVRAMSPNFGVMEQQSGAHGWDFRMISPMPAPGQMFLWVMQSIAHGADFISFFRWRTAPYGTEIYWHGLNDYSNRPNRRLRALKELHALTQKLADVAGSRYAAQVALVSDYLNEWDGERDLWHGPLDAASRRCIFLAAQESHTPLDMVYIRHTNTHNTTLKELLPYKVLFYPHAAILTKETADLLKAYCMAGGTLIMGARTGYKDEYGRCPMQPMPGHAVEICGVEVSEYTFARFDGNLTTIRMDVDDTVFPAPIFHDVLAPLEGTKVLARFSGSYYEREPALTLKEYEGGGAAYYLGAGFDTTMAKALLERTGVSTPYGNLLDCPREVELAVRESSDRRWYFLLYYTPQPKTVYLLSPLLDAASGEPVEGGFILPPYGVGVLTDS